MEHSNNNQDMATMLRSILRAELQPIREQVNQLQNQLSLLQDQFSQFVVQRDQQLANEQELVLRLENLNAPNISPNNSPNLRLLNGASKNTFLQEKYFFIMFFFKYFFLNNLRKD